MGWTYTSDYRGGGIVTEKMPGAQSSPANDPKPQGSLF